MRSPCEGVYSSWHFKANDDSKQSSSEGTGIPSFKHNRAPFLDQLSSTQSAKGRHGSVLVSRTIIWLPDRSIRSSWRYVFHEVTASPLPFSLATATAIARWSAGWRTEWSGYEVGRENRFGKIQFCTFKFSGLCYSAGTCILASRFFWCRLTNTEKGKGTLVRYDWQSGLLALSTIIAVVPFVVRLDNSAANIKQHRTEGGWCLAWLWSFLE